MNTTTSVDEIVEFELTDFDAKDVVAESVNELVRESFFNDDVGDANLYKHLYSGKFIYRVLHKKWYKYKGPHWEVDEKNEALCAVSELYTQYEYHHNVFGGFGNNGDLLLKKKKKLNISTSMKRVVELAATGENGLAFIDKENAWNSVFACRNGVIELRTGIFREGRPEDYIFNYCDMNYDPNAGTPNEFLKFLKDIFEYDGEKPALPDKSTPDYKKLIIAFRRNYKAYVKAKKKHEKVMVKFIQRLLGYTLLGTCKERKFIILYGPEGANGKTTLMTLLVKLLQEYAGNIDPKILLSSKADSTASGHSSHLVDLCGKLIVIADEIEENKKLDNGTVKRLTGNGQISARAAHSASHIRFYPTYTIFLLTNNLPHVAQDPATWNRIIPIHFKWSYVENPQKPHEKAIDKNLGDRLLGELPEILKWLVDGALEYQEMNTLAVPDCIYDNLREYKESTDNYKLFVDDCLMIGDRKDPFFLSARKLYNFYTKWCKFNGYYIASEKMFSQHMQRLGLRKHDVRVKNCWCYVNADIISDVAREILDSDDYMDFTNDYKLYLERISEVHPNELETCLAEEVKDFCDI
ncbi:DNA primase family protein [Desulfonatronum parangueonense]